MASLRGMQPDRTSSPRFSGSCYDLARLAHANVVESMNPYQPPRDQEKSTDALDNNVGKHALLGFVILGAVGLSMVSLVLAIEFLAVAKR